MDLEIAQLAVAKKPLTNDERMQFDAQYAARMKSPTTALMLSLFLGGLGVDRFYLGQALLGGLKLCTLGGLFVWALIDVFLIRGAARNLNQQLANDITQSLIQMRPEPSGA